MTATTFHPRMSGRRARADSVLMLAAAHRGGLTYARRKPWPVFLVNDQPRPDARTMITQLITDGLLHIITDPESDVSEVKPTTAGLAKIGATV